MIIHFGGFGGPVGKDSFFQAIVFAYDLWKDELRDYAYPSEHLTQQQRTERVNWLVSAICDLSVIIERVQCLPHLDSAIELSDQQRHTAISALSMVITTDQDVVPDYKKNEPQYQQLQDKIVATARMLDRLMIN